MVAEFFVQDLCGKLIASLGEMSVYFSVHGDDVFMREGLEVVKEIDEYDVLSGGRRFYKVDPFSRCLDGELAFNREIDQNEVTQLLFVHLFEIGEQFLKNSPRLF